MPDTFDLSEMRMHLQNYVNEIADLLTSPEEMQNYANLCDALFRINSITNFYYTPGPDGTLPEMNQRDKLELRESYERAIRAAAPLLSSEDTGEVGSEMRRITRELAPLLQADADALDQVDLSKTPMRLPEIIGKGRTLAVDLGNQPAATLSGLTNSRQYIRVEGGESSETGYFTPTVTVNPTAEYHALLDRLQQKYPAYGTIIDGLRQKTPADLYQIHSLDEEPLRYSENKTDQEKKDFFEAYWYSSFYYPLGFRGNHIQPLAGRADYHQFSNELFRGLKPIRTQQDNYIRGTSMLKLEEGQNIDKRNIAYYRMAGLLHKQDLVPGTRPMTVIQNGQPVTGTFMAEAHGTDINRVKPGDPILGFKAENFENPAVFSDIAAMQALDFICGNVDRHAGNFLLRFEPKEGENAKLSGISLIDNDMSFSHAAATGPRPGSRFVRPKDMGVIGEEFYNAMRLMTREQMEIMLSDCGLTEDEINRAWERKEVLLQQIEEDKTYFADKEPGYTEDGRIRLVKEEEWQHYTMENLANTHESSQFATIVEIPGIARASLEKRANDQGFEKAIEENRRLLGIPAEAPAPVNPEPSVGHIVGNGLQQNPDPLGIQEDPDTVNLVVPSMSMVPFVGNCLSKRYVLEYEENGEPKKVFYTPPQESTGKAVIQRIFADFAGNYPQYEKELRKIQDYYREAELMEWYIPGNFGNAPASEMGFSKEEAAKLGRDPKFFEMYQKLAYAVSGEVTRYALLTGLGGMQLGEGKRIDLRNVAMSDVGDILGQPDLLARSRTSRIMTDGKIVEGVVMDLAKGEDPSGFLNSGNHPVSLITEAQAKECYNQPSALKQIADMQILDYVCMNVDRHEKNLFYQYEGLGTDHPKLVGVQGIDNDASFGTLVPNPDTPTNHMPALNAMQVISAEMWEKLNDPKTPEEIEEKMRLRGLSDEEIDAAKQRVLQIKDAVRQKKLRVVGKEDWGKGWNSFEKLANGKKHNLFRTIRISIVEPNAKHAEEAKNKPGNELKPYVKKELDAAKCVKSEGFGEKALQEKSYRELKAQTEFDFLADLKEKVKATPASEIQSEQRFLQTTGETLVGLNRNIGRTNPFFHGVSRTYKNFIAAGKEFEKLNAKLSRKLRNPDDALSAKDSAKLIKAANKLKDCAAAYKAKKDAEVLNGRQLDEVEQARVRVSDEAASSAKRLLDSYQDTLSKQIAKDHPMHLVQTHLNLAQGALSGRTGAKLQKTVAEVLYFKSLTKIDLGTKKSQGMKNAVIPREIRKQRNQLMELPAFKKLAKMPDSELRSLAAGKGADKLMDRFINEMAKEKQEEKKNGNQAHGNQQPEAGNQNLVL